jgi:hypothetical protein
MIAPLLSKFVDPKIQKRHTGYRASEACLGAGHVWFVGRGVDAILKSLERQENFQWISTFSKTFSAKMAYLAFFEGRESWPLHEQIWSCKAPLKFKLFTWKVAWDRCWTGERCRRHGLTNDDSCPLSLQETETIEHLLQCYFARSIWFAVMAGLGHPDLAPLSLDSLQKWWSKVPEC